MIVIDKNSDLEIIDYLVFNTTNIYIIWKLINILITGN